VIPAFKTRSLLLIRKLPVTIRSRAGTLERIHEETSGRESALARWYALMRRSRFLNFVQLREVFPQADQVGKFTVFNIGGNRVRLIAALHYK
jgi:mRNA interferase HigB